MDQVEAYLREHQIRLELVATRLLEANTVQGTDLDQLLSEEFPTMQRQTLGAVTDRAKR